jgi:hypothetical protein
MSEFTPLRETVDTLAERTPQPDFAELQRRATRRGRRRVVLVAAAAAAVIAGSVAAVTGLDDDRRSAPAPVEQPEPVVGAGPVWYDAKGLHRGDVVEQTPVELRVVDPTNDGVNDPWKGALALVRSGAVYVDPATGDVWFHPWGGDPRIVGHNSAVGPVGDPNGDTAAWFEGSDPRNVSSPGGELVVYDTAAGREISRTSQAHGVDYSCCEHRPPGNGFQEVSAERVVWDYEAKTYSHDVGTRTTSVVQYSELRLPGGRERYPNLEADGSRLSPSGNYVLAVERPKAGHGAVIVDTRTGELWQVPRNVYPWLAWSYGDIAMVDHDIVVDDTGGELLACDAARRTCQRLPAERPFLMPTN